MPSSITPSPVHSRPFAGIAVACLLLGMVEAWLHTDDFLHRFRSVFAAGRAVDKILAVAAQPPDLLVIGNSRVDNGIMPGVFAEVLEEDTFNLGLPGADACNLAGVVRRLDEAKVLGGDDITRALYGVDEGLFQRTTGLGYAVFFDEREALLAQGRIREWIGSWIRLYGYNDSLRTLQEPAKLLRLVQALPGRLESWGGSARDTRGFRAADEVANQAEEPKDAESPHRGVPPAPDAAQVACFTQTIDLLQQRGVSVWTFPTPALDRPSLLSRHSPGWSRNHQHLAEALAARGVEVVDPDFQPLRIAANFANPGHLNRRGAEQYSHLLARQVGAAGDSELRGPRAAER